MDADVADAQDRGGDERDRRLAPDAEQGEGGHGQGRQRYGDGAEGRVHVDEPSPALEVARPGGLVQEHEGEGRDQPQQPRHREAPRAHEDDGRARCGDLACALEREQDAALVSRDLRVAFGLAPSPGDVRDEQHRQEDDAGYRESELHGYGHLSCCCGRAFVVSIVRQGIAEVSKSNGIDGLINLRNTRHKAQDRLIEQPNSVSVR